MIEPNDLAMGDGVGFDWDGDRRGDHVGLVEDGDSYSLSIITGAFGWSAVTLDIAMGESQAQGRKGVSDAAQDNDLIFY